MNMEYILEEPILEYSNVGVNNTDDVIQIIYPKFIRIGLLLHHGYKRDDEALLAFLVAVQEINNNPNILTNTRLLFTVYDSGGSYTGAVEAGIHFDRSFNGKGVSAVIGTDYLKETKGLAELLQDREIAQIHYCDSAAMSHEDNYPYTTGIHHILSMQGKVLADAIHNYFRWDRVVVFYSITSSEFSDTLLEFYEESKVLGISIQTTLPFTDSLVDFTSLIGKAEQYDPNVIVILSKNRPTARLMEQMYNRTMLREGVTVLGLGSAITGDLDNLDVGLIESFSSHTDVEVIMRGFMALTPQNHLWRDTARAERFLTSFKDIDYGYLDSNNAFQCSQAVDDDGLPIFFNPLIPGSCISINTSTYTTQTFDPYTGYAYDATWAVARSFHDVMYNQVKTPTAELITKTLGAVEFDGLTGKIIFGKTRANSLVYGGDRLTSLSWSLVNFNKDAYMAAKIGAAPYASFASFVSLATLDYFGKITDCMSSRSLSGDYQSFCGAPVFNTASGMRHDDTKPDIDITRMEHTTATIFYAFAAISIFTTLGISITIVRYNAHRQVKRLQPKLLLLSCIGFLLAAARVFTGALDASSFSCGVNSWLGHLAISLYVFPQAVKFYRVYVLLVLAHMKKVTLSDTKMFLMIAAMTTIFIACIAAVVHGVSSQTFVVVSTAVDMQNTIRTVCPLISSGGDMFLYLIEILAIGAVLYFNYALRESPAFINETTIILATFGGLIAITATVFGISLVSDSNVYFSSAAAVNSGFVAAVFYCQVVYYGKLIYIIFVNAKKKRDKELQALTNIDGAFNADVQTKTQLKFGTFDQKEAICRRQLQKWNAILVNFALEEAEMNESKASSKKSKIHESSLASMFHFRRKSDHQRVGVDVLVLADIAEDGEAEEDGKEEDVKINGSGDRLAH